LEKDGDELRLIKTSARSIIVGDSAILPPIPPINAIAEPQMVLGAMLSGQSP
jgi:hypothetical protein